MTPEQLDALFPNRREECLKAGLNPDLPIIPRACKFETAEQIEAVFPNAKYALPRALKRAAEYAHQQSESESA